MTRAWIVTALAALAGCGGPESESVAETTPPDPDGGADAGSGGADAGGCTPAELAVDGGCRPAGIPAEMCAPGFAADGAAGCVALDGCAKNILALPEREYHLFDLG